jgi:hypothetical protein
MAHGLESKKRRKERKEAHAYPPILPFLSKISDVISHFI